uniref:Histone protein n=1 Tax=Streptomyces sp. NBC_01401 TaxID=2903854 RepID=A0AAU3GKN7_9ACTN
MENSKKVALAAAVSAGYVLGRTKKGKLALGVASFVMGQQLPLNPRDAIILGARKLADNPAVAPLVEQARGEVLDAGRAALSATANRRLEAVADALQERTEALLEGPHEEGEEEPEREDSEEEPEHEDSDEESESEDSDEESEDEDEEPEEEEPPRRRPAKRAAAKKPPAKKAAPGKPAKKAAAKKPPPEKATAKKSEKRDSRRR